MDEQLLREFLAEAEDLVDALFGDIRVLREGGGEGRARRESVARIFRHVHTIKGTSAAAGLEAVSQLAHEFETLLDAVRAGRVEADEAVLDTFESAVEAIAASLGDAARGQTRPAPREVVERLRSSTPGGARGPHDRGADATKLPEDIAASLGEHERQRIRESVSEGARVFVVTADFDLMSFDDQFRQLSDALSEGGEIVSTLTGVSSTSPDLINFRIVYATREGREEVSERAAPFGATLLADPREDAEEAAAVDASLRGEEFDVERAGERGGVTARPAPPLSSLTMLVRVPLEELDDLISATHELFTDAAGALDLALKHLPTGEARGELEIQTPRMRRRFFDLEERLIELRMVPVRTTLERAARVGASAARAAGREVEFETRGGDVRLDKSLAESVSDPLLHLLRNAVDHGVEPPAERLAAGKPARGRILLEAVSEGSRVLLRVADDGRGIDPESVARAARERGHLGPEERLTEENALRFIFRPGFSTAAELSAVSGRGVGLDVVERAVEDAGGELRVWSRRGEGTTFEMRLPTTLALVSSVVVRAGGDRYCVASSHIEELGRVERSDLADEGGARRVRWRGAELPLFTLRELLGRPAHQDGEADGAGGAGDTDVGGGTHLIISHIAARETAGGGEARAALRAAVAVDGWEGHGEVLVRSLGRHATRWRGVSGATELRDGAVALVLDLPRLLEMQL